MPMSSTKIRSVKTVKINFDHSNLIAPHPRISSQENINTRRSTVRSSTTSNSDKSLHKSSNPSLDYYYSTNSQRSCHSERNRYKPDKIIYSAFTSARTPLSPIQSISSINTIQDESTTNNSTLSRTNDVEVSSSIQPSVIIDEIERKSKQTKLEIENFKSELEKLISSNITLKENKNEPEIITNKQVKNIDVSKENMETQPIPTKISTNKHPLKKKLLQNVVETPKVEKVIHYDPKSAREYMKKQKLQRQNKLKEELRSKIALKEEQRRKLKELQEKTMYNKNKSKPMKKKKNVPNNHKDEKCQNMTSKGIFVSDPKQNVCSNSSQKIDNIDVLETIRSSTKNEIALVTPNCHLLTEPSLEERNYAATKIQSAYKGFKQRVRYREILQKKRTEDAVKKQQLEKMKAEELLKNSAINSKENVPSWLQPATLMPYPYNFITAVKQKINLALYGYQYQKIHSSSTNLTSTQHTKEPSYTEEFVEDTNESVSKTDNIFPHGLDAESIHSEIKSMQSIVSELKLDLRGINSATNSEDYYSGIVDENVSVQSNKKSTESRKSLSVPVKKSSLPSPEGSPNSTGHDIESAILSISASEHIPFQPSTPLSQAISTNIDQSSIFDDNIPSNSETNFNLLKKNNDKIVTSISETSSSTTPASNNLSNQSKKSNNKIVNSTLKIPSCTSSISKNLSNQQKPESIYTTPHDEIQENSESSSSPHLTAAEQLIRPKDKLNINTALAQNISNVKSSVERKPQEINLKFEAEIRLLETFRESLKQIAADNAVLLRQCIQNGQEVNRSKKRISSVRRESHEVNYESNDKIDSSMKIVQTAQTENTSEHIPSIPLEENNTDSIKTISFNDTNITTDNTKTTTKTYNDKKLNKTNNISKKFEEKLPFINYKRGSGEVSKERHSEKKFKKSSDNIHVTKISDDSSSKTDSKVAIDLEVYNGGNTNGFSLEMIDQEIRNEDIHLEHFKTLLKIREKALIDRTKGELAWLEITKKQLKEKGNIVQASAIKKKQRALILRLQQEKNEMERLKLMHKASCEERKIMLKEQKNLIKKNLSTKDMLKQLKKSRAKEVKSTGPMKVYDVKQQSNESVISAYDDPTSQQSYSVSEEFSIRSRSVVNGQSEIQSEVESIDYRKSVTVRSTKSSMISDPDKLKKSLLKKEEELKRRRERVEELLQWHQRLTEEEKQVAALEEEARQLTLRNEGDDILYSFSGVYLNTIWFNITQNKEKKYDDSKRYFLSKIDIDNFYEDAKKEVLRKMNNLKNVRSLSLTSFNLDNPMIADKSNETKQRNKLPTVVQAIPLPKIVPISLHKSEISEKTPELDRSSDNTSKIDSESITLKSEIKSSDEVLKPDESLKTVDDLKSPEKDLLEVSEVISLHDKTITNFEEIPSELDESIQDVNDTEIPSQSQAEFDILNQDILESPKDLSETDLNKSNISISSRKSLSEQFLIREETNERNFHKLSSSISSDSKKDESVHSSDSKSLKLSENIQSDKIESKIDQISPPEYVDTLEEKILSIKSLSNVSSEHPHTSEGTNIESMSKSKSIEINLSNIGLSIKSLSNVSSEHPHTSEGTNIESMSKSKSIEINSSNIGIENLNQSSNSLENNSNVITENESERINISNEIEVINSSSSNSALEIDDISNKSINLEENEFEDHSKKSVSDKIIESNLSILSPQNDINTDISIRSDEIITPELINNSSKSVNSDNNSEKHFDLSEKSTESPLNKSLKDDASIKSIIIDDDVNLSNEHSSDNKTKSTPHYLNNSVSKDSNISDEINNITNGNLENSTENILKPVDESSDIENNVDDHHKEHISNKNDITVIPTDLNDFTPNYSQDEESYTTSNHSKDSVSSSDFNLISATDLDLKFDESKDFDDILPLKNDITLLENISMPEVDITSNSYDDTVECNVSNDTFFDKEEIEEDIVIDADNFESTEVEQTSVSDYGKSSTNQLIVNEAEELLRKQLEIELEIKELEKQQQSEIVPYVYVREIPNKPPPPYTPPTPKLDKYTIPSSSDQLTSILMKTSDILYTAYTNNSLDSIEPSTVFENSDNEIENNYNRFLFDLCKEITFNFFITNTTDEYVPSWMKPTCKKLCIQKQNNKMELENLIISKVNEYLGFCVTPKKDNLIICWSRKKRDHVDELLLKESQAEESEWTNFESDEVAVKNELTSDIFDLLLNDTISIMRKINAKKIKIITNS